MIAVVTLVLAFPLGYLLRSLSAANLAYAVAYLWAFTFQSTYLTRMWAGGDHSAFPKDPGTLPLSYGFVAAAIFGVGFGLVGLGHWLRSRRGRSRLRKAA